MRILQKIQNYRHFTKMSIVLCYIDNYVFSSASYMLLRSNLMGRTLVIKLDQNYFLLVRMVIYLITLNWSHGIIQSFDCLPYHLLMIDNTNHVFITFGKLWFQRREEAWEKTAISKEATNVELWFDSRVGKIPSYTNRVARGGESWFYPAPSSRRGCCSIPERQPE